MALRKKFILVFFIFILFIYDLPLSAQVSAADIPQTVKNQASFENWLERTGRPVFSRYKAYRANYEIFRDYRLLSYGKPSDVPGNRYNKPSGQYAAHGFSYDEIIVTNTYFPEDSSGISNPYNWKNINLGRDAQISWQRLSSREKEHVKNAQIFYMGMDFGGMDFSSLKLTEQNTIVIAIPSWYLGFALYTNHYNSRNELRYATLHGKGIGSANFTSKLVAVNAPADKVFKIPSNKDYLDITFKLTVNLTGLTGLAKIGDIAHVGLAIGDKTSQESGKTTMVLTETIRFYRKAPDPNVHYQRAVKQTALSWIVTVMGDILSKETSYSFTLIEESRKTSLPSTSPASVVFDISGKLKYFSGGHTPDGFYLEENERRFLSLEQVTVRLDLYGKNLPEAVSFYLPEGRMAKPLYHKINSERAYAIVNYILPVLPSSLTWTNERKRSPYTCFAYLTYPDCTYIHAIWDIEVTGTVYDILYFQGLPPA